MVNAKNDPRVKRTQKELKKALLALMQRKDFADITISELTEKAEVSRGSFYRYYATTADLLNSFIQEVMAEYDANCKNICYTDDLLYSGVKQRCMVFYNHIEANKEFYRVMSGPHGILSFQKTLQDWRLSRFRKRYFVPKNNSAADHENEVKFFLLAEYIVYAQLGLAYYWLQEDSLLDINCIGKMAADFTYKLLADQHELEIHTNRY